MKITHMQENEGQRKNDGEKKKKLSKNKYMEVYITRFPNLLA